ncbi:hypothetical protein [Actinomadura nitritigenes]|uniref:hypothetical protein n=1 Tax=Actinomadura nitritigenes TaxID=134602 RepID=UPI003D9339C5
MARYAFHTDSEPARVTLFLEGAWLHNPTAPQTTVRQYRYGRDVRSTTIGVGGTTMQFAGRRFPVIDFGEQQTDTYAVKIHVPNGPTYRSDLDDLRGFAEAKTTLVFRDNRGRAAYGALTDYSHDDQSWGSEVSFTFTRVDTETVTA